MSVKCQTPLHRHRLRTCCTTPPTDKFTTVLQLVQQIHHQRTKICHIAMPEPNISSCQLVKMLGCGKFLSVRGEFVVSSSVGGVVQHVRSRVRVVELNSWENKYKKVLWTRKAPACLLTLIYAYGKRRLCINIHHYAPSRTVLQQEQRRASCCSRPLRCTLRYKHCAWQYTAQYREHLIR